MKKIEKIRHAWIENSLWMDNGLSDKYEAGYAPERQMKFLADKINEIIDSLERKGK